jgi:general secretion pathway protein G
MNEGKSKRWLERLIALIMASIMVLVFFERVEKLTLIAERESVNQYLSTTRVGIQMFVLDDIVRGKLADIRTYENTNPMRFYQELPSNYVGEFSAEAAASVKPGQWYYDTTARKLVYRVSHYPLYEGDRRKELRYRLHASATGSALSSLSLIEVKEET